MKQENIKCLMCLGEAPPDSEHFIMTVKAVNFEGCERELQMLFCPACNSSVLASLKDVAKRVYAETLESLAEEGLADIAFGRDKTSPIN